MKQGTFGTLQKLAIELERQNHVKQDVIANTAAMRLDSGDGANRLIFPVDANQNVMTPVNHLALRQIGTFAGIPVAYQEKLKSAPELLDRNVNYWLEKEAKPRMVRVLDGTSRAFLSNAYKRIDNYPMMEMLLTELRAHDGINIESCDVTTNRMYLKLSSERLQGEIKKGDIVQFGIAISNSEVGLGAYDLRRFMYTLACTNGMIMAKDFGEGVRKTHLGSRQEDGILYRDDTIFAQNHAFRLQVRDTIRQLLSPEGMQQTLERLRATTERKVTGDPVKAVEVLGKIVGYTQEESTGIMRHLIEGGDLSQYGLMNAVTRFAQDADSYDRATEFEQMGGQIIELPARSWKQVAEAA